MTKSPRLAKANYVVKEGDSMRIGFIGAGKMGFTLGKHLKESTDVELVGYFSRNPESAKEAAKFTDTKYYDRLEELTELCDALFITVPDDMIAVIAGELDRLGDVMEGKILCHTSGALSSQIFSDMHSRIYGYSIHPMCAVSSKTKSHINFSKCFITIEGHKKYLEWFNYLFFSLGHEVKIIGSEDKVRYHGAAVMASNLVIGLYKMALNELVKCGFNNKEAENAIALLFKGNADKLAIEGCEAALTGPVERCDLNTILNHMSVLDGDALTIYRLLSKQLVEVARKKHGGELDDKYDELLDRL